ncbi:hypothetical protein ACSBR2_017389 [Camellia fascicularis]
MDPLMIFIRDGRLPEDKKEAHKVRLRLARFCLSTKGHLYKRSFTGPLLRCVYSSQVEDFSYKVREDVCGSYVGGRSLVHRAITQGISAPTCRRMLRHM